jgi:hypothetical protein
MSYQVPKILIVFLQFFRHCDAEVMRNKSRPHIGAFVALESMRAKAILFEQMLALTTDPIIHLGVRHLTISLLWLGESLPGATQAWQNVDFRWSLVNGMNMCIRSCRNLTSLSVRFMTLHKEMVDAISNLLNLHTLTIIGLTITSELQVAVLNRRLPSFPTVLNLIVSSTETDVLLCLLTFFPNLRTMALNGNDIYLLFEDTPVLPLVSPAFRYLQRLSVEGIDDEYHEALPRLYELLTLQQDMESSGTPSPLTHLSIALTNNWTDPEELESLLEALSSLPTMRVLVVENLQEVLPATIRDIADATPSLEALTLTVRLPHERRPGLAIQRIWAHPSWQYAFQLAAFRSLKFFRWNAAVAFHPPAPGWDLVRFEGGYDQVEDANSDHELQ